MSYYDTKLEIYEQWRAGEISEAQKDVLLVELEDRFKLETFCETYGLIPVDDDDIVFESIAAKLGEIARKHINTKEVKQKWNALAKKFEKKWSVKVFEPNEKPKLDEMKQCFETLKKGQALSFGEYKKNFVKVATTAGLTVDDIILEHIIFDKDKDSGKERMCVRYGKGKQRVTVPNGTCLLHVSPVAGMKEMKPAFCSKTEGKYMYPSPRCFFTLAKEIAPSKAGLEDRKTYRYTPIEFIQYAYIDPSYTSYKVGSVYVETIMPIRVMDFDKRMRAIYGVRESTQTPDVDKMKRLIFESREAGLITAKQEDTLLEYLK